MKNVKMWISDPPSTSTPLAAFSLLKIHLRHLLKSSDTDGWLYVDGTLNPCASGRNIGIWRHENVLEWQDGMRNKTSKLQKLHLFQELKRNNWFVAQKCTLESDIKVESTLRHAGQPGGNFYRVVHRRHSTFCLGLTTPSHQRLSATEGRKQRCLSAWY